MASPLLVDDRVAHELQMRKYKVSESPTPSIRIQPGRPAPVRTQM
jgi:hypothetical protein